VFLVSASFSAGNLDDNLNVNHDHETEYENELFPILDFDIPDPILENPFDSNYFEDLGSGFESNMFEEVGNVPFDDIMSMTFDGDIFLDDINTSNTFQEPLESNTLVDEQDVWQDILEEVSDEDLMNLDPTSLESLVSEFEAELASSSGTKENEIKGQNNQEKTYSFLDKLKDIMNKLKTNTWTNKLQEIIDNYNNIIPYHLTTYDFETFEFSVKNYIFNDPSDRIKQGIDLIRQNVNLPENDKIKIRLHSIEQDLETLFKYYDNILKIVFRINEWIRSSDSKADLGKIQSDIKAVNELLKMKSVDEIIRKTVNKVYEIYKVIRKQEKNGDDVIKS